MADDPEQLDPELLLRLGKVVARAALVEDMLGMFLSFLLDANPASMFVVTVSVAHATQIGWARTLATNGFEDDATRQHILDLLTEIDEVRAERNVLVHGLWQPGPTPGTALVRTIRLDRSEIIRRELVTEADLDELFSRLSDAFLHLCELGDRYGFPKRR